MKLLNDLLTSSRPAEQVPPAGNSHDNSHGNGRHHGQRRRRPRVRDGVNQAVRQADAALFLVQHGFTTREAVRATRSSHSYLAAMKVVRDNGDVELINDVKADVVSLVPTAKRIKPMVAARKAFAALSDGDKIEFARREGAEKLFNEVIVPASVPAVVNLVVE